MDKTSQELAYERAQLARIISIARDQLGCAEVQAEEKLAAIALARQEMLEDTANISSRPYSSQNFHEMVDMNQHAQNLTVNVATQEMETARLRALVKMVQTPYFARIDLQFDDEDAPERIYIGRSNLMNPKTYEIYVYDWRAPIASVFYRYGLGPVSYEAPAGVVSGEVGLKRQYEIKDGVLEYFFDADIEVVDEFLRQLLSQNTSTQMKTIVETIQKDQDVVIRDMENDLVMVQGVAGSGKTSIALHRVAYLMYNGLATKLSPGNIVIISPNTLFEQYISSVLPELGEQNVESLVFEDIMQSVLRPVKLQTRNQLLEALLCAEDADEVLIRHSLSFKTSSLFVTLLNRFVRELPYHWIEFTDVDYGGAQVANRELMKAGILSGSTTMPLGARLKQLERAILKRVHALRADRVSKLEDCVRLSERHRLEVQAFARQYSIHESTTLIREIRKFTELDCRALYRKLFSNKPRFYRLAKGLDLPDDIDRIIDYTCDNLMGDVLQYDDAAAITYMNLLVDGAGPYKGIKQVVVDEAQDYDPLHFEVLNRLFPRARYTVLGDIHQTIGKRANMTAYDEIARILSRPKSALATMDKSFRCTREILTFGARFLDNGSEILSFSRAGEAPQVFAASDAAALDALIVSEVAHCRSLGYCAIGLITKTERDAIALYERLRGMLDLRLITGDNSEALTGVLVLPIYMSKGLEFDAVLIPDADAAHYRSADDKKLLYIACTRALHRLNLFHMGEPSPLLKEDCAW